MNKSDKIAFWTIAGIGILAIVCFVLCLFSFLGSKGEIQHYQLQHSADSIRIEFLEGRDSLLQNQLKSQLP